MQKPTLDYEPVPPPLPRAVGTDHAVRSIKVGVFAIAIYLLGLGLQAFGRNEVHSIGVIIAGLSWLPAFFGLVNVLASLVLWENSRRLMLLGFLLNCLVPLASWTIGHFGIQVGRHAYVGA